jgi:hypothetical protein
MYDEQNTNGEASIPLNGQQTLQEPQGSVLAAGQGAQANVVTLQRKKRKSTSAEVRERTEAAIELIVSGARTGEIKKIFREKFGLKARRTMHYIRLARERMAEILNLTREDGVSENYWRLVGTFSDPTAKARDKIMAVKVLNEMMGWEAPKKIDTMSTKRKTLELVASRLTKEQLLAIGAARRAAEEVSRETGTIVQIEENR